MLVGGTVVSAFSLFGEVLEPKSFAGLLSAAEEYGLLPAEIVAVLELGAA